MVEISIQTLKLINPPFVVGSWFFFSLASIHSIFFIESCTGVNFRHSQLFFWGDCWFPLKILLFCLDLLIFPFDAFSIGIHRPCMICSRHCSSSPFAELSVDNSPTKNNEFGILFYCIGIAASDYIINYHACIHQTIDMCCVLYMVNEKKWLNRLLKCARIATWAPDWFN